MRFLGIDYGMKRIGTAISDEDGTLAFPKEIIENNENVLEQIGKIVKEESITEIVVGESVNFKGEPNVVEEKRGIFVKELKAKFNLPTHLEKEFLTTVEARRYSEGKNSVDASAAALILQRYLDKLIKRK